MRSDSLGKRLRDLRRDYNLTQTELRDMMEQNYHVSVGQNHISELERGTSMPSAQVLIVLCKTLRTNADYLLMLSDDPTPVDQQEAVTYLSPEADEIASIVDKLPADARADLLAIARRTVAPDVAEQQQRLMWLILSKIEDRLGHAARRTMERALFLDDGSSDVGDQ